MSTEILQRFVMVQFDGEPEQGIQERAPASHSLDAWSPGASQRQNLPFTKPAKGISVINDHEYASFVVIISHREIRRNKNGGIVCANLVN